MNSNQVDIWKMLAGIAFFLLAMDFMETTLRLLAGRRFKLYLKNQTNSKLKAIGGAALVTALLQSSSIVNLLVLSMVGAGVLKMENALALTLGSNLGTTLYSWVVALFGFTYNIESLVLPIIAITGIGLFFFKKDSNWFLWLKLLFSLAFVFVSLGYINSGMESVVKNTDLASYTQYSIIVYLFLGIILTAIIQSSSATMAITLSALHTHAITLYLATAIVLGSEIGTTLKLFIASANGISAKKRVALGNFLFNIVTVFFIFLLLRPVNYLISDLLQINNNLIALVFFQTFLNVFSIVLFFPLLNIVSQFLKQRYSQNETESSFISKVSIQTETNIAIEALEKETKQFMQFVMQYGLDLFNVEDSIISDLNKLNYNKKSLVEKYDFLKQLHGEMHGFYLNLQIAITDKNEAVRLEKLVSAIGNTIYAAKNFQDSQRDIIVLKNSSNDVKFKFYNHVRQDAIIFYRQMEELLNCPDTGKYSALLEAAYQSIIENYSNNIQLLYKENMINQLNDLEITTLINFNRELHTGLKSILFGLKAYLLNFVEAGNTNLSVKL